MTSSEFKLSKDILWDSEHGPKITTSEEISNLLAEELRSVGVNVTRVGRKPRSRNKFILFSIMVQKVKGTEITFLTKQDAANWHRAKNRNLNTMMKAPDEAFKEVEVEEYEEMIWWNQAFSLAYRMGSPLTKISSHILRFRGTMTGVKFGI